MAETSPLLTLTAAETGGAAEPCPRCGRIFEKPIELEVDGKPTTIRGHQVGDPKMCVPLPGQATVRGTARDARARRSNRRGS